MFFYWLVFCILKVFNKTIKQFYCEILKKSKKCSASRDGKMPIVFTSLYSRYTLGKWCEGSDLLELKCVNWNAVFEASSDCYWIVKLSSRTHQQKLKLSEDILCEKDLEVIHFVKSIQDWMHRCIELTSFTYYPHLLSLTLLNLSTLKKNHIFFINLYSELNDFKIKSKIRMGSGILG